MQLLLSVSQNADCDKPVERLAASAAIENDPFEWLVVLLLLAIVAAVEVLMEVGFEEVIGLPGDEGGACSLRPKLNSPLVDKELRLEHNLLSIVLTMSFFVVLV